MKKILIIEDDPKHLQDAKNFFSTVEGIEVTYRDRYEYFTSMTRNNTPSLGDDFRKYDGVISDIYFPIYKGETVQPIGVSVMFQCKMMNIPCVLCTAGYHHGDDYQWINDMWSGLRNDTEWKNVPAMVDSMNGSDRLKEKGEKGEEVATKGWSKAWEVLQKLF
jgi:hypothetical protein